MKMKVVEMFFDENDIMPTMVLEDGSVKKPYRRGERIMWLTQTELEKRKKELYEMKQKNPFTDILDPFFDRIKGKYR